MKLTLLISGGMLAAGAVCALTEVRTTAKSVRPVEPAGITSRGTAQVEIPADSATAASEPHAVSLRECTDLLSRGRDWLQSMPDYTAVFQKQERVGEDLRPLETIDLKVRHAPFSIAMTWRDLGRIAYYQDHADDNRMLVRMGGWKRRLGWIHLDPHSSLAMNEARYPITDVGLLRLTEQLLERFEPFQDRLSDVHCTQRPEEAIDGRLCRVYVVDYASAAVNADYRRSIVWLDAEWSIPLAVQNFDWSTTDPLNPEGMIEYYVYENVRFRCELCDADFTVEGRSGDSSTTVTAVP